MTGPGWTLSRSDRVATLSFSRPPDDQVRITDLYELDGYLAGLARDREISVVVLTGGRPGAFVGHAAADDICPLRAGGDPGPLLGAWAAVTTTVEQLPQPVVALVDGPALGGGCELALACTVRIAGPSARFQQVEIIRGAIPGAGATQRLPRLVGPGAAARMVLAGEAIDADEAYRIGLVDVLVRAGAEAGDWVHGLAGRPRDALVAAKDALRSASELPLADGLRRERELFGHIIHTGTTKGREQACEDSPTRS